ncbi:DUF2177 family protein [Acholeplasma manati]|uniref:DUF2177 family protein n=1 Tax=Paracholeplasma manati TaxID=591373 RepID=A0ABT2Y4P4_9MOLU|nr:DUF2177 family protein [Paracholeplasma manati]MCV2231433.1 DUF2177 family protein [Paracholeplasma manati]
MLPILKLYGIAFVVFFVVDLIWLGLVAKDLYQKEIGSLLKPDVNWAAAIIFYLLFILGLVIFVINPAVESGSLAKAMMLGVFFGLVTYATYDLTNLATMRDFTLKITLIDLTWGTTLGFLTSTLTYLINDWLF